MSPEEALAALASHRAPFLIGVRHHSPVLAAALPELLAAADPDAVLVELPEELERWLPWLGHPDTAAPVALSVAGDAGGLGFYPFADFSPELVAVRWALKHGIPVHALDLPAARMPAAGPPQPPGPIVAGLLRTAGVTGTEELWDRLVESRSYGAGPERVRRAALALGWALRLDAVGGPPHRDLVREEWMRRRIAAIGAERPAAVVGAFHAPALAGLLPGSPVDVPDARGSVTTALIPYSFDLLDSRSGYPAGIRDPEWQQAVLAACGDPEAVERAAAVCLARVCAELRRDGHVAGTPDLAAAVRLARDLAVLRGLPAPGRRELVEALGSALGQGEPLGRARAVARAAERALVGTRRGRPATQAPRSGLVTRVEALLDELRLPSGDPAGSVELRLDPARSPLDLRRHLALSRLSAAGVVYATRREVAGTGEVQALTRAWTVHWRPVTAATLEAAAVHGLEPEQAAEGALRTRRRHLAARDLLDPAARLGLLEEAAECALPELVEESADELRRGFVPVASLPELLAAHELLSRIAGGHFPGLPRLEPTLALEELLTAAVGAVEGLAGSGDRADAVALGQLVRLSAEGARERLLWRLRGLAGSGAPLPQGAAGAALLLLDELDAAELGTRLAGWVDGVGPEGMGADGLSDRLAGVLIVAGPLVESVDALLDPLAATVEGWPDERFLARLPALRDGFDALSTAARGRFFEEIRDRLGGGYADLRLSASPARLAAHATADLAGRAAVLAFDASLLDVELLAPPDTVARTAATDQVIGALDRWRLILGRERERAAPPCRSAARALDELYGGGRGEGSGHGTRGGDEAPYPTAREWASELEDLFGATVRDEVLGRAAARGRTDALLELDPERVTASVDLLEHVLSLAGALPEAHLGRLRRLVDRIVSELTRELARRLAPALTGLSTPRPTRRPGGPLDLGRTIRANLATARRTADGGIVVLPERPVFRTRARRSADWHVHIVVDVSGSMERSTIYSALVAAVLHGVPALSVRLTTFSTEIIEMTGRVPDPLSLLLEISVGGGTDIGRALAHARGTMTVPSRTIIAVVTDFEEGGSVGRLLAEVRALAESGAHLLGLAALDDTGLPVFNRAIAEQVAAAGMPVAALSPTELAAWIGKRVRG